MTVCKKTKFATEKAATDFMRGLDKSRAKQPVRAYKCPKCGGWHITSQAVSLKEMVVMLENKVSCPKIVFQGIITCLLKSVKILAKP